MDRRGFALGIVLLAAALELLDGTIVNVVLPAIQREFGTSTGMLGWIASSYTLALGAGLTIGGRLGDTYGPRRMLAIGTAGFIAAALVCSLAPNTLTLLIARITQGGAAALAVPQTLALIQLMYPPAERGRPLSLFATVTGVATVGGLFVGGALTELNIMGLGWRTVFLLNLPIGAVILCGLHWLPDRRAGGRASLDLPGMAMLSSGLLLLMFPLLHGSENDWPGWVAPLPVAALVALACFAVRQHRRGKRGYGVLVDTTLFSYPSFTGAVLISALVYAAVFGLFFTMPLFLQRSLGFGPLAAGLTILPWSLGIPLASIPAARWLVPRFGRRILVIGLLTLGTGMAIFGCLVRFAGTAPSGWQFLPGLLVSGCGMGMVVATVLHLGLAEVPARLAGTASGVLNNVQQLAGALGVAAAAAGYAGMQQATGFASAFQAVILGMLAVLLVTALPVQLLPARRPRPR